MAALVTVQCIYPGRVHSSKRQSVGGAPAAPVRHNGSAPFWGGSHEYSFSIGCCLGA
ncbi:uncharacterized protein PHACADRAFT_255697 [Phanerochaete carnosa HHB-10118-sp]|uniref:Uncharacterized protein n=1 Tax=Phanerochaete carnosa (strain HHB-10118-sp) TaxID=650164 RepID=K5UYK4_PHACS|nr:uncharacterized protein PHACADRAFT_255697 [Phanerochaete carnosa HHB-10118-sp]EKM55231.1 hypothetical protein PHACADRAFT_255697 [Phanerochaete carnosa HHB-10118-sp]